MLRVYGFRRFRSRGFNTRRVTSSPSAFAPKTCPVKICPGTRLAYGRDLLGSKARRPRCPATGQSACRRNACRNYRWPAEALCDDGIPLPADAPAISPWSPWACRLLCRSCPARLSSEPRRVPSGKTSPMLRILVGCVVLAASPMAVAQQARAGPPPVSAQDARLLRDIARSSLAEIAAGKLALDQARAEAVRKFGQLMVDVHSKLLEEAEKHCEAQRAGGSCRARPAAAGGGERAARHASRSLRPRLRGSSDQGPSRTRSNSRGGPRPRHAIRISRRSPRKPPRTSRSTWRSLASSR